MKKEYEQPIIEVIEFSNEDAITTSAGDPRKAIPDDWTR